MKNIFSPHVREVHITEDRTLRLRVTGIGQAIDVLSFIAASLKILGPMHPEASIKLGEEDCGGVESVEISYMPKEKAHHKNVYVINLFPQLVHETTLIFNEDDVVEVDKRLKQLIHCFTLEVEKDPLALSILPFINDDKMKNAQSVGRSNRTSVNPVEVYIIGENMGKE